MQLRALSIDDLPQVMDLERRLFQNEAWLEQTMAAEIASPQTHYVGAFDGSLLGYAGLKVSAQLLK